MVPRPVMRNLHLLACLVLSGFAGLAYELLWVRLLALGFGSTTLSFSTVLAVFFGGLALGAWVGGRVASRLRRPVRAYALVEVATGVLALVLYPAIAHIGSVFAFIDPGPGIAGGLVRAALAGPLLLGPTVLMGATLPIVTRAIVVEDSEVGSGSALIYGFNTLGAFLGTYLITYFLLPELGVFLSTLVTVGINLAVGVVAVALEDREPLESPRFGEDSAPAPSEQPIYEKIRLVASGLAFLGGFAAICFQVVWVRLFSIFLDGTVYGVGSVLIAVLVGIGLGSLLVARPLRDSRNPALWFSLLQAITLVSVSLVTLGLPWIAYVLRTIPEGGGGLLPLHLQLLTVFLVLLVPSLASGASFPVLMSVVERRAAGASQALGALYASNTVGSITGSLLTGFVLIPLTGTVATLFLGVIVVGLVGAIGAMLLTDQKPIPRLAFATLSLLLVAFWPGFDVQLVSMSGRGTADGKSYHSFLKAIEARKKNLVFFSEGQAATVAVSRARRVRSLTLNGLGQGGRAEFPPHAIYESLLVALVPMAHVERPKDALVVGLGAGVTVDALLDLGAESVEVVELEEQVVDGLSHIFPEEASPLRDPRVRLRLGDARHALLIESRRGQGGYDIITSMPAHPWVASSIFTQEFFELARANLTDQGVFSTWFGLGRMDQEAVDALTRAFTLTFENYVIYAVPEAGALYLVGSKRPLTVDVARFAELRASSIVAGQESIESDLHLAMRVAASGTAQDPPTPGIVNTDDSAFVEVRAPRTSSVARGLGDVLPQPWLKPEMLEPADRRSELALAVVEALLGTPDGRLPIGPRPTRLEHAERMMKGFLPLWSASARAYLEGRIAHLKGNPSRARDLLQSVTEGSLASRARRFLPFTWPRGSERNRRLRDAPNEWDIWAARLAEDDEGLMRDLPESSPPYEVDPWGWLVFQALTETAILGPSDRARFSALGRDLLESPNLELLERVFALAQRSGFTSEAGAVEAALVGGRRARAQVLFREGREAGKRGDFSTAAERLSRALTLDGTLAQAYPLLVMSLVELGREAELETLKSRMRFAGFFQLTIESLIADARAGKLAQEVLQGSPEEEPSEEQPAPQITEPGTAGTPASNN